jgi:hypothetical protein
MPVAWLD